MFESFGRSWNLMKQSFSVLKKDKELIAFPILSGVFAAIVIVSFLIPIFVVESLFDSPIIYVLLLLMYIVLYFFVVFFNAALVGAAMIRMGGQDPTLGDGLNIAFSNIKNIFLWAVVAGTVGLVLRMLASQSKKNFIASILVSIIGAAWTLLTYFVVPTIVVEGVGPLKAIRKSKQIIFEKWRETILGGIGFGWIQAIFSIIAIILFFIVFLFLPFLAIPAAIILILAVVFIGLVFSALAGVFSAAVYYASVTGENPDGIDLSVLKKS